MGVIAHATALALLLSLHTCQDNPLLPPLLPLVPWPLLLRKSRSSQERRRSSSRSVVAPNRLCACTVGWFPCLPCFDVSRH